MHNELCERLGIEFPIFAFTHCRDVAAAVSNAGGLGVLGAVGFSADELEVELSWLDEHVGDRPYGVDIVIPGKYEGMGELDPVKLEEELRAMIPEEHRTFAKKILADHGVPELEGGPRRELLGWTAATAAPLVEVILRHDKVKLVANALGTPPDDVIAQVHDHGMLIAALAGSVKHALNHKAAGVDIVICQGSEGGGHTGDVGSIVLWPEVIDAVAPLPVLAAGGVGSGRQMAAAMVMGAAGVWTGSLWLTVEEADVPPKQMESYLKATSRDTVRSRSFTGKPCRLLKNDWTEAWEAPGNPKPLGMPLQMMVAIDCVSRGHAYPEEARDVNFNPAGQIIGRATSVRRTKDVVLGMVEEYIDAVERLQRRERGQHGLTEAPIGGGRRIPPPEAVAEPEREEARRSPRHGSGGRRIRCSGAWTLPRRGSAGLLGLVPRRRPVLQSRPRLVDPATTSTSTTSSVTIPEGSAAEVAACQADAQTLEAPLEAYMVQKGSFPSPAPWSAATYVANFGPLTAAGGGGPYLPRPPDTKFYVIEYDSSGHVWVAPPGSYGATYNPGQSFDASTDVCLAAVR